MTYEEIVKITGPAGASKLCSDDFINNLPEGEIVDALELDSMTRGAVIIGVEPIEYPDPSGLAIYLKLTTGDIIELNTTIDHVAFGDMYFNSLCIRKKHIQDAAENPYLVPCPLCGAAAKIMHGSTENTPVTWVECERCGQRTAQYKSTAGPDAVQYAACGWNHTEHTIYR